MRRRKLSSQLAMAGAVVAALALGGCATDTLITWEPSVFDRDQVPADLPSDEAVNLDGVERESVRLVDDTTVDRLSVYVARQASGSGYCLIAVRDGAAQAHTAMGCGPAGVTLSGGGLPRLEYFVEADGPPPGEGWVYLGDGVSVRE